MRSKIIAAAAGLAILGAGFGGGLAAAAVTASRPDFVQVTHPAPGGGSVTQAWNCANEGHPARHFWWFRNCRKA